MTVLILKYYMKIALNFTKEFYAILSFLSSIFVLGCIVGLNRLDTLFSDIEFGNYLFIIIYGAGLVLSLNAGKRFIVIDKLFLANHLKSNRVDRIKRNHITVAGALLSMPLVILYYIKFGLSWITAIAFSFSLLVSLGYSFFVRSFEVKAKRSMNRNCSVTFFKRKNDSRLRYKSIFSLLSTHFYREVDRVQIVSFILLLVGFNLYVSIILTNNQLSVTWPYLIPAGGLLLVYVDSCSLILKELFNYSRKVGWTEYFASISFSTLSFSVAYFINCIFLWLIFSVEIIELLISYPLFLLAIAYIELLKIGNLCSRILRWLLIFASVFLPITIPLFIYRAIKGFKND